MFTTSFLQCGLRYNFLCSPQLYSFSSYSPASLSSPSDMNVFNGMYKVIFFSFLHE